MTTLIVADHPALPQDLIDLRLYLDTPTRAAVAALYKEVGWEFEPPDAWLWRFADVCALYFRVEAHADFFTLRLPHLLQRTQEKIRSAIIDYLEDEFS